MSGRTIRVIGIPVDLGGVHRGVDMGPSAIRVAGLVEGLARMGHQVIDLGNVHVPLPQSRDPGNPGARYLAEIAEACTEVAALVEHDHQPGDGLIFLGGDHSAAIGSVGGVVRWHRSRGKKVGLIWVDAHTDMNTPETSPSGNIHGMPVACLLGRGPKELVEIAGSEPAFDPSKVVLIAIRSIDPTEKAFVRESGVTVLTMRDIDEMGARGVMRKAIEIATDGTDGFHFSFDMDGVDSQVAPGVGTPVRGGLTYREAHLVAEMAYDSGAMLAMDMMEVDPVRDVRNKTAQLGSELILSAFGHRIL